MAQWERERAETRLANSLLSAGKLRPEPLHGDICVLGATVARDATPQTAGPFRPASFLVSLLPQTKCHRVTFFHGILPELVYCRQQGLFETRIIYFSRVLQIVCI